MPRRKHRKIQAIKVFGAKKAGLLWQYIRKRNAFAKNASQVSAVGVYVSAVCLSVILMWIFIAQ